MKKSPLQITALLTFVLSFFWAPIAYSAEPIYPDRPVDVRITGTLLPYEEEPREDLITMKVFVEDTPWLLRIGKIEDLTTEEKKRAVEEGVLMRQVRFIGSDEALAPLRQADIAGKVLVIEGNLDFKAKRFRVKSVTEQGQ